MKSDKIYLSLAILLIFTIISWVTSCTHDAKISDQPVVCFDRDILPIFTNNCNMTGCHGSGGHGGGAFDSYATISRDVVAGNPNKSGIYQVITDLWGFNRMPPKRPLSIENRTLIRVWIEQGAAQTVCTVAAGTPGVPNNLTVVTRACFTRDIQPVIVSRCASANCHDAISHKSGYNFTSFANIMTAVRAGNPGSSTLYQVLKISSGEDKMPPAGKPQLTVAEIDSIGNWIGYGALNETCGETCDTLNPVTFSGTIWPVIQSSCTGCHSGTSPSGNVLLASYSNVATVASNGLLIKSLNGTGVTRMPPTGSFSACRIKQFQTWVNNGFINN
jgi:hypothetical protein